MIYFNRDQEQCNMGLQFKLMLWHVTIYYEIPEVNLNTTYFLIDISLEKTVL